MNQGIRKTVLKALSIIPDKTYLKMLWNKYMDYPIDLKSPKTFSEKIVWLKLYDRKPLYTMLADKYAVKKYVSEKCGEQYVVRNFGMWKRFDDIDFDTLPDQFVLKCNHASGGIAICKDKRTFNKAAARQKLTNCLKSNFYYDYREWVYKDIEPCIIAEEFIGDDLQDYRVYCFNGEPKIVYSYTNKSNAQGTKPEPEYCDIFDVNWKPLPYRQNSPARGDVPRPPHLEEMLEFSRKISQNIPFVRVDLYDNIGRVLFSECTFYPGGGMSKFRPQEWDSILGSWLNLPINK